ncbi:hypothetical protein PIB30_091900 [Stylosanthes scabra]|uniref:Uncharacterized protein n=1 Tax=Stylosanthes scabra TaxID=79078 RepID=A0ABU6YU96_9FABA|nr:hypothetical protein [Stylosanthes scabra]
MVDGYVEDGILDFESSVVGCMCKVDETELATSEGDSNDVEDQTIEDFEKTDKPTTTVRRCVDHEPSSSTSPPVDPGDVQVDNDGVDLHGDPTPQPKVPDAEVPPDIEEPPVEP